MIWLNANFSALSMHQSILKTLMEILKYILLERGNVMGCEHQTVKHKHFSLVLVYLTKTKLTFIVVFITKDLFFTQSSQVSSVSPTG